MSYALAVVMLLIAAGLRQWQLATLPPGLSQAEFTTLNILDENIRAGRISIFYQTPGMNEPQPGLYHTVVALVALFTGDGILSHRVLSVWAGMVTLALTYTLGVRLFGALAGLCALALLAVMMAAVLLSRAVLVQASLPLLVMAILTMLARAFPVYRYNRDEHTSTVTFATLGVLLGLSFYVHPISLILTLASMIFIGYMVIMARPLLPRLSYIGFAFLLLLIVTVPFLLYILNRPENLVALHVMNEKGGMVASLTAGLGGIMFRGDSNPAHNVPQRPLIDLFSGVFMAIGLLVCLRYWRQPRFALLLIALVMLAPSALVTLDSPDFFVFAPLLPLMALLFGSGVITLVENMPSRPVRRFLYAGLIALLAFNGSWITRDLFVAWPATPAVQAVYHSRAGQLAHYLDITSGNIPTVLCDTTLHNDTVPETVSSAEMILRLMNRRDATLRRVNCLRGMVFINGGERQQVILPDEGTLENIHPYIRDWLNKGIVLDSPDIPAGSVILLNVTQDFANSAGRFTTTAPAQFATEDAPNGNVFPPVRLGENVTWLGYEQYDTGIYKPGDVITIITYWRAEGAVPVDLNFFFHVLSDPVTVVRQRDTIVVRPRDLQDRDVFIQVTEIDLTATMLPGEYMVSVGAYRSRSKTGERLPVFDSQQQNRGSRLLLYPITIQPP